jgi:hypothetical protein
MARTMKLVQAVLITKPQYTEETTSFCLKYKRLTRGVPAPTDGKYTSSLLSLFKLSYVHVRKRIYCSIYMFFPPRQRQFGPNEQDVTGQKNLT